MTTNIPPYSNGNDGASPVNYRAHDGTVVVHASNLSGPDAVGGYSHAWPQSVDVDMGGCEDIMYMNAREVYGYSYNFQLHLLRSGFLVVRAVKPPIGPGTWKVSVVAQSPSGLQRQTQSVAAWKDATGGAFPYHVVAKFRGLTTLRNFTAVTVTVSRQGKDRTWMTLSRTP